MAEVAATAVVAEGSTAAVALAAGDLMVADFLAVATVVAPTAVITVADTPADAALTAATVEDPATRVVAAPTEECAARPAPTTPGPRKVRAFATHHPAGIRLRAPVTAQPCPEDRVPRATNAAGAPA